MDNRNHFYLVSLQENPSFYFLGQIWFHILVSQTPTGGSKDAGREYTNAIHFQPMFYRCSMDKMKETMCENAHSVRIRTCKQYLNNSRKFIETTDAICDKLDKHTLEEVQKYLELFAKKCGEGRFEELVGVNLFQWDGKDRNGLDLWLCMRGSLRTENVHQKM
jgi:hypothetical protein